MIVPVPQNFDLPNFLLKLGQSPAARDALAALNADCPAGEQITPDAFQGVLATALKAEIADQRADELAQFEKLLAPPVLASAIAKLKQPKA